MVYLIDRSFLFLFNLVKTSQNLAEIAWCLGVGIPDTTY